MKLFSFRYLGMIILLSVVGFLTVYPLGMIIYGSFRSAAPGLPGYFTLQGYIQGFSDPSIIKALLNTFALGIVRTIITSVLAIFLCWILIRTDTPFKGVLELLTWISFFIPLLPMTMGWILLLDPSYGLINQWLMKLPFIKGPLFDIYSFWGIVWVHIPFTTSLRVLMFAPAFRNMDAALEDSARMSGASNIMTLIRITFPLLIPAIIGSTMLGFIRSLESFEVELLLGMPSKFFVFSTKVYDLLRWEPPQYPPAMALSAVFMVIVIAMIFLNRWVVQRREYTTVTGKGYRTSTIILGKWRYATMAFILLYAFIFLILPGTILIIGTFMKVSGMFSLPEPYTMKHWKAVLSDPLFIRSSVNSMIVCVSAAVGGMTLYSLISYISIRTKLRGRGILDFMSWLPWTVPGLLLAVALLWVFLGGIPLFKGLYGTLYILIIAMIIKRNASGCARDGWHDGANKQRAGRICQDGWCNSAYYL